jgi:hypothetical protein
MITATPMDEYNSIVTGRNVTTGSKAIRLLVGHGYEGKLWMSDSKDEFNDHLPAIEQASGRVLVHGLGLGCYLASILSKPEVTHVDVVEKNADVLSLITPYFSASCPKCGTTARHATTHTGICGEEMTVSTLCGGLLVQNPRITFHHADAYKKQWPKGTRWNFVWHDIWPTICSDDLENHAKLNRKFGHRADVQGAWAHDMLLSLRRRNY